jgi:hypothetical protein
VVAGQLKAPQEQLRDQMPDVERVADRVIEKMTARQGFAR